MKELTIQVLLDTGWVDAASLTITAPEKGIRSPMRLGYLEQYSYEHLFKADLHACSIKLPLEFATEYAEESGLRFLDDIMPAGSAYRFWEKKLGISDLSKPEKDLILLEQGTIAPVGNLRIKESLPVLPDGSTLLNRRFPMSDVVERNTDFLEYAAEMGAISGGATGAGGEAPKLLLRRSTDDEVWIDTFQDQPQIPDSYYLVKFPRGKRTSDDCDVLRAEYHYYQELANLGIDTIAVKGMQLIEGDRYPSLWLPRFDVQWKNGCWYRSGLESVYSILGVDAGSTLNHFSVIEKICELFPHLEPKQAFDKQAFVCEWVKRDLLNICFGNSDNHGRNTAFLKTPDGQIKLAPIYDFAPMKADPEGVHRTTTWGSPFEEGGEYDFLAIANRLNPICPSKRIMDELQATAKQLLGLKQRLAKRNVPDRILSLPSIGFDFMENKLTRWGVL